MASGDTKTNQYLDIAANGTRADLPSDTCCETRTQTLIREVAERIIGVEEDVEEIKNSPDVVDIVDTYAALQNYDTSGLTDKDVVRVITDETKGGLSSYYRWNSPNAGWNFVGVIPGADGVKELSSADYNYPTANPDRVALWLLDNGLYTAPAGVLVAASTTSYPWYNTSDKTILVGGSDTVKGIYTFLNGKTDVVTTQASDGTEAEEYTLLKSNQVLQATGQSTSDTMSQKAITDALAEAGGGPTVVQTTGSSTTDVMSQNAVSGLIFTNTSAPQSGNIMIGYNNTVSLNGTRGIAVGRACQAISSMGSTALGDSARAAGLSSIAIGAFGVADNSQARALGGNSVAVGCGAHATQEQSVAIGSWSDATANYAIAIGGAASGVGSIAIGRGSSVTQQGEMNIGTSRTSYGYNSSNYRLLTGLYDPQSAHDAATKGYVDTAVAGAGANTISSQDWSDLWQ